MFYALYHLFSYVGDASANQGLYMYKQTAALHFSATSQPIVDPAVVHFDTKSQLANFQRFSPSNFLTTRTSDARAILIAAATGRFCPPTTCITCPGCVVIHCNSKLFYVAVLENA